MFWGKKASTTTEGDVVQRISESSTDNITRIEADDEAVSKKQSIFSIFNLAKASKDKSAGVRGAADEAAGDSEKRPPVPSIIKQMKGRRKQLFYINEAGEFVDNIFREHAANSFYSQIIGRGTIDHHSKKTFVRSDIACEGYLFKKGSWFKTWKRRYFILRKDIKSLCYFKSKDNLTLLGTIKLDNDLIVDLVDDGDKVDDLLVLKKASTKEMILCMKSESVNDKNKWRFEIETELYSIQHNNGEKTDTNEPSTTNYNAEWWETVFAGSKTLEVYQVCASHDHQSVDTTTIATIHVPVADDGGDADAEATSSKAYNASDIERICETTAVKVLHKEKSKKIRLPPIRAEYIQSYIDNETSSYSGFQLSVRFSHLVFNNDLVYVIIYGSKSPAPLVNGEIDSSYVNNNGEWEMVCHTEVHHIEQQDEAILLPSYIVRFTLLQELFTKKGYANIKVVVMLLSNNITQDKLNTAQSKVNQRIVSTMVFNTAALHSSPMQASMKVNKSFQRHIEQSIPVDMPKGFVDIGFVAIKSVAIMKQQAEICKSFCISPYAERLYSFPCVSGQTISDEIILASDFGVLVARSMAKLFCDERSIAINNIKTGIMQSIKSIESDNIFVSAFSHKNMSLVDVDSVAMALFHKKENLEKASTVIDEVITDLLGKLSTSQSAAYISLSHS